VCHGNQTATTTRSSSAESGRKDFLIFDHLGDTERIEGIRSEIKSLAAQRSLTLPVNISYGFDSFPFAMTDLLEGRNFGQQLVELG
jgi:NADPH-dependent curcumin reductase CurA